MTKNKNSIERLWWIIPLIIMFFSAPFYYTLDEMTSCYIPITMSSFFSYYSKNIPIGVLSFIPFDLHSAVAVTIFFSFLWFGYRLAKKHPSFFYRVIIVSALGLIGQFLGFFKFAYILTWF